MKTRNTIESKEERGIEGDIEMIKESCQYGINSDKLSQYELEDIAKAVLTYISYCPDSVDYLADVYTRLVYTSLDKFPNSSFFTRQHKAIDTVLFKISSRN